MILEANMVGLEAKLISLVFKASSANSGDDITIYEMDPVLRWIKEPYVLAMFANVW